MGIVVLLTSYDELRFGVPPFRADNSEKERIRCFSE
jgi:hypothetical protein